MALWLSLGGLTGYATSFLANVSVALNALISSTLLACVAETQGHIVVPTYVGR